MQRIFILALTLLAAPLSSALAAPTITVAGPGATATVTEAQLAAMPLRTSRWFLRTP
jgi:hypothetical protein